MALQMYAYWHRYFLQTQRCSFFSPNPACLLLQHGRHWLHSYVKKLQLVCDKHEPERPTPSLLSMQNQNWLFLWKPGELVATFKQGYFNKQQFAFCMPACVIVLACRQKTNCSCLRVPVQTNCRAFQTWKSSSWAQRRKDTTSKINQQAQI